MSVARAAAHLLPLYNTAQGLSSTERIAQVKPPAAPSVKDSPIEMDRNPNHSVPELPRVRVAYVQPLKLREEINDTAMMKDSPRALRQPEWRDYPANVRAQFAGSLVGFAVPTALAAAIQQHAQLGTFGAAGVYAALIFAFTAGGQRIEPWILRKQGGAVFNPRISFGSLYNHDPYKLALAKGIDAVLSVLIYGASHLALTAGAVALSKEPEDFFNGSPGGQFARAAISAGVMALVKQAFNMKEAKNMLVRNEVTHVKELSSGPGNSTWLSGGVFNNAHDPNDIMTTSWRLTLELGVATERALGCVVLMAATMVANMTTTDPVTQLPVSYFNPMARSAISIMGGVSMMFIMGTLAALLIIKLKTHPGIHIQDNIIPAHLKNHEKIAESGMPAMEGMLDRLIDGIERGADEVTRTIYENALMVLTGKAFRGQAIRDVEVDATNPQAGQRAASKAAVSEAEAVASQMASQLASQVASWGGSRGRSPSADRSQFGALERARAGKQPVGSSVDGSHKPESVAVLPDHLKPVEDLKFYVIDIREKLKVIRKAGEATQLHDTSLVRVADDLQHAIVSLDISIINGQVPHNGVMQLEVTDIRLQLRSAQSLLIKCVYRLDEAQGAVEGRSPEQHPALEDKLLDVTNDLLPLLAALRKNDRINQAIDVFSAEITKLDYESAIVRRIRTALTAKGHKRLLVSDLASHVDRLGARHALKISLYAKGIKQLPDGTPINPIEAALPHNTQSYLEFLKADVRKAHKENRPNSLSSKILILEHEFTRIDPRGGVVAYDDDTRKAHLAKQMKAIRTIVRDTSRRQQARDVRKEFMRAFIANEFTVKELADELHRLRHGDDELSAGGQTGEPGEFEASRLLMIGELKNVLGEPFMNAIAEEAHPLQTGVAYNEELLRAGKRDIDAWPAIHRDLTIHSLQKLDSTEPLTGLPMEEVKDFHNHHTGYSGLADHTLVLAMHELANNVTGAFHSAIPTLLWYVTMFEKYYATTHKKHKYGNNDALGHYQLQQNKNPRRPVINVNYFTPQEFMDMKGTEQLEKMGYMIKVLERALIANAGRPLDARIPVPNWPDEMDIRIGLTSIDPTDAPSIEREMFRTFRSAPDFDVDGNGEGTVIKEAVGDNNPSPMVVNSEATFALLYQPGKLGRFAQIHTDAGTPNGRMKSFRAYVKLQLEFVLRTRMAYTSDNLRALPGNEDAPDPAWHIVNCHWSGLKRFSEPAFTHTWETHLFLDNDLIKNQIAVKFYQDIAWDQCMFHVWQSVEAHMKKARGVTGPARAKLRELGTSIDQLLKSYLVFGVEGGLADTSDEAKMLNPAAVRTETSREYAMTHLKSLRDDFLPALEEAVADEEVRKFLINMCVFHGDPKKNGGKNNDYGNNFLFILFHYADSILFGTDVLSFGNKPQGEAAFAINARNADWAFCLFHLLAQHDERFVGKAEAIARGNFDKIFNDKPRLARKAFVNQHVARENGSDHSGPARPKPLAIVKERWLPPKPIALRRVDSAGPIIEVDEFDAVGVADYPDKPFSRTEELIPEHSRDFKAEREASRNAPQGMGDLWGDIQAELARSRRSSERSLSPPEILGDPSGLEPTGLGRKQSGPPLSALDEVPEGLEPASQLRRPPPAELPLRVPPKARTVQVRPRSVEERSLPAWDEAFDRTGDLTMPLATGPAALPARRDAAQSQSPVDQGSDFGSNDVMDGRSDFAPSEFQPSVGRSSRASTRASQPGDVETAGDAIVSSSASRRSLGSIFRGAGHAQTSLPDERDLEQGSVDEEQTRQSSRAASVRSSLRSVGMVEDPVDSASSADAMPITVPIPAFVPLQINPDTSNPFANWDAQQFR